MKSIELFRMRILGISIISIHRLCLLFEHTHCVLCQNKRAAAVSKRWRSRSCNPEPQAPMIIDAAYCALFVSIPVPCHDQSYTSSYSISIFTIVYTIIEAYTIENHAVRHTRTCTSTPFCGNIQIMCTTRYVVVPRLHKTDRRTWCALEFRAFACQSTGAPRFLA